MHKLPDGEEMFWQGGVCAILHIFQMVEQCMVWLQICIYLPITPHISSAEMPLMQSLFQKHSKYPPLCEDFLISSVRWVFLPFVIFHILTYFAYYLLMLCYFAHLVFCNTPKHTYVFIHVLETSTLFLTKRQTDTQRNRNTHMCTTV